MLESEYQLGACQKNDLKIMIEKSDKAEGDTRVRSGIISMSLRVCDHESLERHKDEIQSYLEIEEKGMYIT